MQRQRRSITYCLALACAALVLSCGSFVQADTPQSLTGSYVRFDNSVGGDACSVPGASQTFCFEAYTASPDWEYVNNVWFKFPSNWSVLDVYVAGTPDCDNGTWGAFNWSFQTPPYEVNISHPRYQAQSGDQCTAYYCFDTIPGTGTSADVSWYWDGDQSGGAPHWPCSLDRYTPAGQQPCDEYVNPRARVVPCEPARVLDTGDPNERACNPRSYTDLGNGIVRDNTTGLEWMQVTAPDAYTWAEAAAYVQEANDNNTLGYDDWRLPSIEELSTLVDAGRRNPPLDPLFNDPNPIYCWSSDIFARNPNRAWRVGFDGGRVTSAVDQPFSVRLVRGGQFGPFGDFVNNGDGTITDKMTDLMWQRCGSGQTWDGDTCTGSAATLIRDDAVAYVQELNDNNTLGYDDWRLPTRNELQTILDYTRYEPATQFPDTLDSRYWSSTVFARPGPLAWYVDLSIGAVTLDNETESNYVRAVRGGPCRTEGAWCIEDSDCDDGVFCNGTETCVDSLCQPGEEPCIGDNATPFCDEDNDTCVECFNAGDCDDLLYCTGDPLCTDGVCDTTGDPCALEPEDTICVEDNDTCVECLVDDNCTDDGEFCNGETVCTAGECVESGDPCSGDTPVCDEAGDRCVECLVADNCSDDSLFCTGAPTCTDNVCGFAEDSCDGDTSFCDEENDVCAECLVDGDCEDDGLYCTGDPVCMAGVCGESGDPCSGDTPVCDEAVDRCVECLADGDCGGDEPLCDEAANACVECLADGDCSATEVCSDDVCIPRCELTVVHKPILAEKLTRPRKVALKVTSADDRFDLYGLIDLGPFTWDRVKFGKKKQQLTITATVPAGLAPGSYPISVGDCVGEVVIIGNDR